MMGVLFGTTAMIVVLSVFNGFDNLVQNLYVNIDPDFKVELKQGEFFSIDDSLINKLHILEGVNNYSRVLDYKMLAKHKDAQLVTAVKGVDINYPKINNISDEIFIGEYFGTKSGFVLVKQKVFYALSLKLLDFESPLKLSFFNNKSSNLLDANNYLTTKSYYTTGVFKAPHSTQEGDIILNIKDLQNFLGMTDQYSSVEIDVDDQHSNRAMHSQLELIFGDKFIVKNRYQQRPFINKIIQSEKLVVYIIFSFILIISMLSLIASLVVLLMQKQQDIQILFSLGLNIKYIKTIFWLVGLMIVSSGLIIGSFLGLLLCFLQEYFHIIKLGVSNSFLIDYYPVKINALDIFLIQCIVLFFGIITTYFVTMKNKFYNN